jgi:hypothetical protein
MGDSANNFSTFSWEGKVHDDPKPFGTVTADRAPLTAADLAEFEQKLLRLMHEMAVKISSEQLDHDRE